MKYNYIFFNTPDKFTRVVRDGYYSICVEDLRKLQNVTVISCLLEHKSMALRKLHAIHVSDAVNEKINLPLKRIWFPLIFDKRIIQDPDRTCFIFSASCLSVEYMRYLKRIYPLAKYVMLHRDLVHLYQKRNPEWTNERMHESFDLVMSYDKEEAKKYDMVYFEQFESKIEIPDKTEQDGFESDVFFAGQAKNRLKPLMEAYDIFSQAGFKCDYYLVGVPKTERIQKPGIVYADTFMSYRKMLERTVNSRCVLDINQVGAVGYTSRFLEAIMYKRKLITNNPLIKDSRFFNERQIQCIDDVKDINVNFVRDSIREGFYDYQDEFSPIHLIERIDDLLS